jgi:hypothetical protein
MLILVNDSTCSLFFFVKTGRKDDEYAYTKKLKFFFFTILFMLHEHHAQLETIFSCGVYFLDAIYEEMLIFYNTNKLESLYNH